MMLLTLTGTVFSRSDHWLNIWSNDFERRIFEVMKFWLMKNWCSGKVDSDLNSTSQIHNRCQFSIKYFSLCETSGYLWNSYVYLSKVNDSPGDAAYTEELGKSGAVVPKLMSELYNKGYHVYMDNWYTSLKLFQHLESNGTAACGTTWKDRIMPLRSLHNESLKRAESAFRRSG